MQQEKYMTEDKKIRNLNKPNCMSDAGIIVILILFHFGSSAASSIITICKHLKHFFPRQVS